jgi:hypothetical protein
MVHEMVVIILSHLPVIVFGNPQGVTHLLYA